MLVAALLHNVEKPPGFPWVGREARELKLDGRLSDTTAERRAVAATARLVPIDLRSRPWLGSGQRTYFEHRLASLRHRGAPRPRARSSDWGVP